MCDVLCVHNVLNASREIVVVYVYVYRCITCAYVGINRSVVAAVYFAHSAPTVVRKLQLWSVAVHSLRNILYLTHFIVCTPFRRPTPNDHQPVQCSCRARVSSATRVCVSQ